MDPEYDLWQASPSLSLSLPSIQPIAYASSLVGSVDPTASSTCDSLLSLALQIDPQNLEALQTLASVRLSQEKPEEALIALRTFPPPPAQGDATTTADPLSHALLLLDALPIQTRIARAKLLLECGAHPDALSLLEGVLAADDANIEGWYLMGWTWWLLAERKKEGDVAATVGLGEDGRELEWQDMARDARDCLETCQTVGGISPFVAQWH